MPTLLPPSHPVAAEPGRTAAGAPGATRPGPAAPRLQARTLHFAWRGRTVLDRASLTLRPGELVGLLGANGAGKSTLLKLLLGLLRPQAGQVLLGDRPLARWGRRALAQQLAYVPQVHQAPFPYRVREVALLGRLPAGGIWHAPSAQDHALVDALLQRLGIAHLADRPYTEVSGGERQLALIARALAQQAPLLVLDEPFAGLDFGHQLRLLARLRALADEGHGVLMSTHDPDQVLAGCHRVLLLRDGHIAADGPPAAVLTPQAVGRLYGEPVRLVRDAQGRPIAFRPPDSGAAPPASGQPGATDTTDTTDAP